MVHISRLTHRRCGTCGTDILGGARYIERGAVEPNMAVKAGGEQFWAGNAATAPACVRTCSAGGTIGTVGPRVGNTPDVKRISRH